MLTTIQPDQPLLWGAVVMFLLTLTFLLADLLSVGPKHSRTCVSDAWAAFLPMDMAMSASQSTPTRPADVIADWLADAAAQDASDKCLGRRRSLWYVWTAPLEVMINPGTLSEQCVSATGINLSEGGMGLLARHALPVGATSLLRYVGEEDASRWVRAVVMYSKRSPNGYRVGARFELPQVT